MPLSKEAQRAWQEQPPKREIHHDTVAPMTRFGRKWLWDLTLNVPVHLLGEALETAAPPPDATTPYLRKKHRFDVPTMELALAKICAELLNLEPHRMRCEVLETKFQTSDRQYEGPSLAPASVQFVLWSQWRQGAGFVKKLPSWAEHPPPRSAPRPARNYLVTCSRGALSEAAEAFQDAAEPELGGEGEAFTW